MLEADPALSMVGAFIGMDPRDKPEDDDWGFDKLCRYGRN